MSDIAQWVIAIAVLVAALSIFPIALYNEDKANRNSSGRG